MSSGFICVVDFMCGFLMTSYWIVVKTGSFPRNMCCSCLIVASSLCQTNSAHLLEKYVLAYMTSEKVSKIYFKWTHVQAVIGMLLHKNHPSADEGHRRSSLNSADEKSKCQKKSDLAWGHTAPSSSAEQEFTLRSSSGLSVLGPDC